MSEVLERKVEIVSCSGEELAEGTVARLAALKVLNESGPRSTVTICLPLFLAGGAGDRAFARLHATITVDGCDLRCAARGTEKYSSKPVASLVVSKLVTAFFLPHIVVPPNAFWKGVRVLGSVAFLSGTAVFLVCAVQVYAGKLFRPGMADRGLYSLIRHPQYLALAVAAWGLEVMWPRFLTLTLFGMMLFLYYLLARDEERRMVNRFGESYRAY